MGARSSLDESIPLSMRQTVLNGGFFVRRDRFRHPNIHYHKNLANQLTFARKVPKYVTSEKFKRRRTGTLLVDHCPIRTRDRLCRSILLLRRCSGCTRDPLIRHSDEQTERNRTNGLKADEGMDGADTIAYIRHHTHSPK